MAIADTDILIIGAGLVGLATAMHVQKLRPRARITVIEKGSMICDQQSGHNSGVLHAGIYYAPGSDKARYCVESNQLLTALCQKFNIPMRRCGKVIVATTEQEVERLEVLRERGIENGVPGLRLISIKELQEREPHVEGLKALHSPSSAIVDFRRIAAVYAAIFENGGGKLSLNTEFLSAIEQGGSQQIVTSQGDFSAGLVVNCAGLQADLVARAMGNKPEIQVFPFRGEYWLLKEECRDLINGLVYPVPNPALPFLGVHFTPLVNGDVEAGPNAILALKREGYLKKDFSMKEFAEMLSFPGFWLLAARNARAGLAEINRSMRKGAFVKALQQLVPEITADDLVPGGSGVRAQAIDSRGNLIDDFLIDESPGAIHVLNAPSPAATSSFIIGRQIARMADRRLNA